MSEYSLQIFFHNVSEAVFKFCFQTNRLLTDPAAFQICAYKNAPKSVAKAAEIANTIKCAFQKKAAETLDRKATQGDIAPKPAGNAAMAIAQEGLYLLSRTGGPASKMFASPMGIGMTIIAAGALIMVDDTSRNMIMDQISQIMALFQNENGNTKTSDIKPEKPESTPLAEKPQPYKHANYYL